MDLALTAGPFKDGTHYFIAGGEVKILLQICDHLTLIPFIEISAITNSLNNLIPEITDMFKGLHHGFITTAEPEEIPLPDRGDTQVLPRDGIVSIHQAGIIKIVGDGRIPIRPEARQSQS